MIKESQLFFAQAASSCLPSSEVRNMWEVLKRLIETAENVRFLDCFIGKTSLDVLKGIGIRNVAVVRMPPQAHGAKNGRTMNIKSLPTGTDTKK